MEIKIDSLIPFDTLYSNLDYVFSVVEKNGKVILLKDNKPAYIIMKFDGEHSIETTAIPVTATHYTLHEAMRIVLSEAKDMTMHVSDLADEIFERKLYLQKNGDKAQYTQVRARCGHYPDLFKTIPGNYIKLKG
ncbi:MAG TPA: hypothetical protein VFD03_09290 [Clostridia bacterium]|nr:hypothetical protein [Clostridia bacterium]